MRPGPVRFLRRLTDDTLLVIGTIKRTSDPDDTFGAQYVNLVDGDDGSTVGWFTAITQSPPRLQIEVTSLDVIGPEAIVIGERGAGLVMWGAKAPNKAAWRYKTETPMYVTAGLEQRMLLIGQDGIGMRMLDAASGNVIKASVLPDKAIGKPWAVTDGFNIPVEGGILLIGKDLSVRSRTIVKGLSGNVRTVPGPESVFLMDADEIVKVSV